MEQLNILEKEKNIIRKDWFPLAPSLPNSLTINPPHPRTRRLVRVSNPIRIICGVSDARKLPLSIQHKNAIFA
jgi:hypothetical protein